MPEDPIGFDPQGKPIYATQKRAPSGFDKQGNPIYKIFNETEKYGVENRVPENQRISSLKDLGANVLKSGRGAATALATGASTLLPPQVGLPIRALIGLASGLGTDVAIRTAQESLGRPEPSNFGSMLDLQPNSLMDKLLGGAETIAGNEITGAAANKLFKMGRGFFNPSTEINQFADEIPLTFGQSPAGGTTSQIVESVTAPIAKARRVKEVTNPAIQRSATSRVEELSGQPVVDYRDKNVFDVRFKEGAEKAFQESVNTSNTLGDAVVNIAKFNVVKTKQLKGYENSKVLNPDGSVNRVPIYEERNIEGPVQPAELVTGAKNYLDSLTENQLKDAIDKERRLITTAKDIIEKAGELDDKGKLVGVKVIPFRDAWNFKQRAQEIGYSTTNPNFASSRFRNLGEAADSDIEQSISQWQQGSRSALNKYTQAKAIVAKRHEDYDNTVLDTLRQGKEGYAENVNKILKDPQSLNRAIASGQDIPALRTRDFQNIVVKAFDPKSGLFNAEKLRSGWSNPELRAQREKLYTPAQLKRLDDWFDQASRGASSARGSGVSYALYKVVGSTLAIGGAVLESTNTLPGIPTAIAGGYGIMNLVTKKILMNPKFAKAMTYMAQEPDLSPRRQLALKTIAAGVRDLGITVYDQLTGEPVK